MNARLRSLVTPTPTASTPQAPTSVTARKGSRETARTVKVSFVASYGVFRRLDIIRRSSQPSWKHISAPTDFLCQPNDQDYHPRWWLFCSPWRLQDATIVNYAFRVDGEEKKRCQTTALQIRTVTLRGADSSVLSQYFGFMPDIYFRWFTPNMLYNFLRTLLRRLEARTLKNDRGLLQLRWELPKCRTRKEKGLIAKTDRTAFCFIAGCHFFLLTSSHNERRGCCVRHDALFGCFFLMPFQGAVRGKRFESHSVVRWVGITSTINGSRFRVMINIWWTHNHLTRQLILLISISGPTLRVICRQGGTYYKLCLSLKLQ